MNLLSILKLCATLKQKRQFQNKRITSGSFFPFSSPLFALAAANYGFRKGDCPWKLSVHTILFHHNCVLTIPVAGSTVSLLIPCCPATVQTSFKILVVFPLSVDLYSHQVYRWPCLPLLRLSQPILHNTARNGDFMNQIFQGCHRDEHRFPVFWYL